MARHSIDPPPACLPETGPGSPSAIRPPATDRPGRATPRRSFASGSPAILRGPWRTDADLLIVGAGASGLSLALHLLDAGVTDRRILLLEPRIGYSRDRTWCWWRVESHAFDHLAVRSWRRWKVADDEGSVVQTSTRYPYLCLPADRFYRAALERLARADNVALCLGDRVDRLRVDGGRVWAETSRGAVTASLAFDSRPPRPATVVDAAGGAAADHPGVTLLQQFVGVHVESDQPAFDPDTVSLMDFRVPQDDGIHFVYVLPFSRHQALVEATFFVPRPLPERAVQGRLEQWLTRSVPGTWRSRYRERGLLPMSTEAPTPRQAELEAPRGDGPRVVPLGLAGGAGKPSTGYAFLEIQRRSAALAAAVAAGAPPGALRRPARTRALDRIFLCHLARHPERAAGIFRRLFARTDPEVLVRFLSDCGTVGDDLAIAAALPKLPFLEEMVRSAPVWLRSS